MSKDSGKTPTPNEQRSDSKNPNNPAQKASQDNRSNQLNPKWQQNTQKDGNTSSPDTGGSSSGSGTQRKS